MQKWRLKNAIAFTALGLAGLLYMILSGCVSVATIARQHGFNAQWRGFHAIPATPDLHREYEIKVTVIIEGDINRIGPNMAGSYSHPQGIIRVVGKQTPQGIIICEPVIGHEFLHALQYQVGEVANPDKLTEYGF